MTINSYILSLIFSYLINCILIINMCNIVNKLGFKSLKNKEIQI